MSMISVASNVFVFFLLDILQRVGLLISFSYIIHVATSIFVSRAEEIVMPAEHTGLVKENYLWKVCMIKL